MLGDGHRGDSEGGPSVPARLPVGEAHCGSGTAARFFTVPVATVDTALNIYAVPHYSSILLCNYLYIKFLEETKTPHVLYLPHTQCITSVASFPDAVAKSTFEFARAKITGESLDDFIT